MRLMRFCSLGTSLHWESLPCPFDECTHVFWATPSTQSLNFTRLLTTKGPSSEAYFHHPTLPKGSHYFTSRAASDDVKAGLGLRSMSYRHAAP